MPLIVPMTARWPDPASSRPLWSRVWVRKRRSTSRRAFSAQRLEEFRSGEWVITTRALDGLLDP
jgi:hypothetical protein